MAYSNPAPGSTNIAAQPQRRQRVSNGEANKLLYEDRSAHDWYRFVLSYPPHVVREYIERFELSNNHRVLDPFCGTGTTVVDFKNHVF
jgi:adenine specific DNA methylase Mod